VVPDFDRINHIQVKYEPTRTTSKNRFPEIRINGEKLHSNDLTKVSQVPYNNYADIQPRQPRYAMKHYNPMGDQKMPNKKFRKTKQSRPGKFDNHQYKTEEESDEGEDLSVEERRQVRRSKDNLHDGKYDKLRKTRRAASWESSSESSEEESDSDSSEDESQSSSSSEEDSDSSSSSSEEDSDSSYSSSEEDSSDSDEEEESTSYSSSEEYSHEWQSNSASSESQSASEEEEEEDDEDSYSTEYGRRRSSMNIPKIRKFDKNGNPKNENETGKGLSFRQSRRQDKQFWKMPVNKSGVNEKRRAIMTGKTQFRLPVKEQKAFLESVRR